MSELSDITVYVMSELSDITVYVMSELSDITVYIMSELSDITVYVMSELFWHYGICNVRTFWHYGICNVRTFMQCERKWFFDWFLFNVLWTVNAPLSVSSKSFSCNNSIYNVYQICSCTVIDLSVMTSWQLMWIEDTSSHTNILIMIIFFMISCF